MATLHRHVLEQATFHTHILYNLCHWIKNTCICRSQCVNIVVFMDKILHVKSLLSFAVTDKAWLHVCLVTCHALQLHVLSSKFTARLIVDTFTSAVTPTTIKTS
jgi:hypothetical protein